MCVLVFRTVDRIKLITNILEDSSSHNTVGAGLNLDELVAGKVIKVTVFYFILFFCFQNNIVPLHFF